MYINTYIYIYMCGVLHRAGRGRRRGGPPGVCARGLRVSGLAGRRCSVALGTYVYKYVYTYIYMYMYTYICNRLYVYMCVCMCV